MLGKLLSKAQILSSRSRCVPWCCLKKLHIQGHLPWALEQRPRSSNHPYLYFWQGTQAPSALPSSQKRYPRYSILNPRSQMESPPAHVSNHDLKRGIIFTRRVEAFSHDFLDHQFGETDRLAQDAPVIRKKQAYTLIDLPDKHFISAA